jgi:hypothetical protein
LIITLITGTFVVFFSKLVLSCHHKPEDEPVPDWLIAVYSGWLGKLAGVRGTLLCCKRKDTSVIQVSAVSEGSLKTPCDEFEREEKEVKWSDITRFLDKILFRFFMSLTCLQQFVFLIIFIYGYNAS